MFYHGLTPDCSDYAHLMMRVSGHKTQKTFMGYIKLSSDETGEELAAIVNCAKSEVFDSIIDIEVWYSRII